jgi:putative SOS response-associated peptidase YedK
MCGRFNVIDDPITQSIMELLGIKFEVTTNDNVCPSELVSTLSLSNGKITQINSNWGIKPDWANKLLINAQSETVAQKKTFKQAFLSHRCLIPLSGWYEWLSNDQGKKQKYLFSNDEQVFYMAAIMFQKQSEPEVNLALDLFGEPLEKTQPNKQFVSLTTRANHQCQPIHSRMPLIIPKDRIRQWLDSENEQAVELLHAELPSINITKVNS